MLSLQEEYRASYTYRWVLANFGDLAPFSHIAEAEAQHIEAVSRLFANRGLDVPPSEYSTEDVPRFASFSAACAAGVSEETGSWQLYAGFLAELQDADALPQDVGNVFTSLMEASRDRHLPAFANCAR